ncbi:MAG: hypothetical protein P9X24_04780 [Candidatus Hatepunaea meridiana]|nr:hypothetical protein [Candidatus Hatepunaea meridiana]
MSRITSLILVGLITLLSLVITGCDTTAERELRRAETAIEEAREYAADEHATDDYNAAEELLIEAAELARDDRIQEARAAAIKSKLRAEDATRKAKERHRILEAEMEELGR